MRGREYEISDDVKKGVVEVVQFRVKDGRRIPPKVVKELRSYIRFDLECQEVIERWREYRNSIRVSL